MENQFATEAHPIGFSRQLIRNSHFFFAPLWLCRLKLINMSSIIWATFELCGCHIGRWERGKVAWRRDLALGSCASSFGVKLREWWYLHYCKLLILLVVVNRLHKQYNDTANETNSITALGLIPNQKSINKLSWLIYFWFSCRKYLPIDIVCTSLKRQII